MMADANSERANIREKNPIQNNFKASKGKPTNNYRQRKKPVNHSLRGDNDIYVNNHSDFQGQLKKALSLFEKGATEVVVHGLGHAVIAASNLSLQVAEKLCHTVELSVATDSVELHDEWEPVLDQDLPFSTTRTNSALHITIRRLPSFPATV